MVKEEYLLNTQILKYLGYIIPPQQPMAILMSQVRYSDLKLDIHSIGSLFRPNLCDYFWL